MPLLALALLASGGIAAAPPAREPLSVRNDRCAIGFDGRTGALVGIGNVRLDDPLLKGLAQPTGPFCVHADFPEEWLLDADPGTAARVHLAPGTMPLVEADRRRHGLRLAYTGEGLKCVLEVALPEDSSASEWRLSVTNTGSEPRSVMVDFPWLDGVRLGQPGSHNLQTVLNQAGYVGDAWSHGGGIYGNGGQWSMQWHALFDPASRSALGLIVEDPEVLNKRLVLSEPSITVRYFPPRTLRPGETLDLPSAKLLVYRGDWRTTARAYADWYLKAFAPAEPPQWAAECDMCEGRHFAKHTPGAEPAYGGQFMLDSFRDLPAAHLRMPFDHLEYAFWSRGSMLYGKHTDGDNVIREDLGGPEAMREGIAGLHRLGLHATLYIEGYIVHEKSDLAREGKAQRWSVMHRDGTIGGPYTQQGFLHMCPGCAEWQDHLVSVVSRVLRVTGADGVRLDSLGFYFLPCYNPEHHHASPFGYNQWVAELLAKVRRAALAENPRSLLTTEAPVDFYGQWFHGALTQVYPRDLPPMRLAVGPYRPFVYAPGGPVWGSISGLTGGRSCWEADLEATEGNWMCAQEPVHEALVWGDVADENPLASDPAIITRRFVSAECEAVVAVRPACQELTWPAYGGLSDHHAPYEVLIPVGDRAPAEIALCDIETLTWSSYHPQRRGDYLVVAMESNWVLAVVPHGPSQVVSFDPLPEVYAGDAVTLRPQRIAGVRRDLRAEVSAPGLEVIPEHARLGDAVRIRVPNDALPGWYGVSLRGRGVLGVKRLLRVLAR